jgi:hypothetical protein
MNGATFIPNVGIRLEGIDSFVEYRLEAPLTDGQMSVIVTNIRNSNEQWKTKLFSMLQGDGVNGTDNSYRFTADRRNRDSGGTVRWTLRSRGVDAGEPNCGSELGRHEDLPLDLHLERRSPTSVSAKVEPTDES